MDYLGGGGGGCKGYVAPRSKIIRGDAPPPVPTPMYYALGLPYHYICKIVCFLLCNISDTGLIKNILTIIWWLPGNGVAK